MAINGDLHPAVAPFSFGNSLLTARSREVCSLKPSRQKWCISFGSPGNDVQPQAMLQVFLNMVLFDMTPQQAVEQPRFASASFCLICEKLRPL